ncbi:hypothetical protein ACOSP7_028406 [Xanthoceras sorbifolium]
MASPQPPSITPQTEMSTLDVDQTGYRFQKLMKIMGSRVTPSGGNCGGNTSSSKETLPHKRCDNKGKEVLPLLEPFSSRSSSQTTGSSQTKMILSRCKQKYR